MDSPLSHSYSSLNQFDNCPRQYEFQRITKEVKPSFGEASMYGTRIHDQLDARIKGTPLPEESAKYEVLVKAFEDLPGEIHGEQEMTLNIKLEPTGWWDDDAWFRAKIDVLVLNGPVAVMGDWKTGKHRPNFTQLEIFATMIFKHYPEVQRVKSCFIWLKDMLVDHKTYERRQEAALWNRLMTSIRRIEAALEEDNWPAKPSGLCPWCPAKHLCEFGG